MDAFDYIFKANVDRCKTITETSTYLEIFLYSDPDYNTVEEDPLLEAEFDDFLHAKGRFETLQMPTGVTRLAGVRIILQQNAQHPETFSPHFLSLKAEDYIAMTKGFHLSQEAIDGTSAVGPLFFSDVDANEDGTYLQIVYRKSDVRKKGKTRGWELNLSHNLDTGITTGFCKGTPSSDIVASIKHLKAFVSEIGHPLLLPLVIFGHDMSSNTELKQRAARDWLRRIEFALSMRDEEYLKNGLLDLDALNRDLVECYSQTIWRPPSTYLQIIAHFKEAMETFKTRLPDKRKNSVMDMLHGKILSRLTFHERKLHGLASYTKTTQQRLEIQMAALRMIVAQKDSRLNFEVAGNSRSLAHATKRDTGSMMALALLGTVFLPGTYIASIFSTTFFDFQNATWNSVMSPKFWLYWATAIPITLIILGAWMLWERMRKARYEKEELDLARAAEDMERAILAAMTKRPLPGPW
ncbi:uncharacterized protein LY89DRAFT_626482 [Mollisia scopiformis]|uniref:Uncharacterized protein n=1 Tax=Mollisia scopiformis TaxID=149040 RepID=A0A194WT91_MOLSC|nr:uncharacterized protein LY89DRAFT_626482 [Mollisia scopiformis]KUJ10899.1 hypothetical protein LY89DRAFT_626482 [Mollisia scopiformis]